MTDTKVSVTFDLPGSIKLFRLLHPADAEKQKWHRKSCHEFRSLVKDFPVVAVFKNRNADEMLSLEPADLRELMNDLRHRLAKYNLGLESLRISSEKETDTPNDRRLEMSLELTVV